MPYITDRVVHDADSHTMELPHWFSEFGTDLVKKAFGERFNPGMDLRSLPKLHRSTEYRSQNEAEIMTRKNYQALGAFDRNDRSEAVDHLGVASQLVFPTSPNVWLEQLEHGQDVELLYEVADATNRAQVSFCAHDNRLFPVGYVPLADLERTARAAETALTVGAKALLIPWAVVLQSNSKLKFPPVNLR